MGISIYNPDKGGGCAMCCKENPTKVGGLSGFGCGKEKVCEDTNLGGGSTDHGGDGIQMYLHF